VYFSSRLAAFVLRREKVHEWVKEMFLQSGYRPVLYWSHNLDRYVFTSEKVK